VTSCRLWRSSGPVRRPHAVLAAWCWAVVATAAVTVHAELPVRVEGPTGAVVGALRSIDRETVELLVDGESQRLPLEDVRTLIAVAEPAVGAGPVVGVEVVGDRGLAIRGDDLRWEDGRAMILRGAAAIELPIVRIRRASWSPPAAAGDAAEAAAWPAAVPAELASDLVAVMRPEGVELVECAITAIAPQTVTVTLDGETIPVNRGKVLGLVWVRPPAAETAASGMAQVAIAGGTLGAATVEWRDGVLVLDGEIRVPGALLRSIDFAAGRTVPLATVEPERSAGEPFFGGLVAIDGLAAFFAPRIVTPDGGRPVWLLRPRSTATWRVPDGSRRFRARIVRMAAAPIPAVVVTARADDGAEWRQRLEGPGPVDLEIAVADARRLTLGVDFAEGGVGVPVRFDDAGFEK
jgi:hypothetical protein